MYAQLISFSAASSWNRTSVAYGNVEGQQVWGTTEIPHECPHTFIADMLAVSFTTAPGAGKSFDVDVMKNGSPTGITLTISGATAVFASDLVNSATFAAGDTISFRTTPHSTPNDPGIVLVYLRQSASGKFAVFGGNTTNSQAANFLSAQGQNNYTSETSVYASCPIACTFSNLRVRASADPGGVAAWTIAFRKSTGDQTLTCTINAGSTAANDTNAAHNVSVSAADLISTHVTITGTPVTGVLKVSYTVTPNTDGQSFWLADYSNVVSGTATNMQRIVGGLVTPPTTDLAAQVKVLACTIIALYVKGSGTPGAGKSFAVTVADGGTGTAATATFSTTSTANITGLSVAVADNDLLDIQIVPSGIPAGVRVATGIAYTMPSGVTNIARNIGAASAGSGSIVRSIAQILRAFKIVSGLWTKSDGTPGNVSEINEVTPDDTTYLQSPYHPTTGNAIERIRLHAGNPPAAGNVTLQIRYKKDVTPGDETVDLVVRLYASGTLIKTRTYNNIGAVLEDDYTLTSGELASITDYSDIEIEFDPNAH